MLALAAVPRSGAQDDSGHATVFDEFEIEEVGDLPDPLSGLNRAVFEVNDRVYVWLLEPLARFYGRAMPESARHAFNALFGNLAFPVRLVNNVLQGKLRASRSECVRFGVNTTFGILGLFDPAASRLGLVAAEEDFGQTLGRYGVPGGPPLMLPLLGPSNLRDALGLIPDFFLSPVNYVRPPGARLAVRGCDRVNYLSLHLGEYEALKRDALDPYTFLRDAYRQNRDLKVKE